MVAPEPDREHQRRDRARRVYRWESVHRLDGRRAVDRRALRERALDPPDVVGADRREERGQVVGRLGRGRGGGSVADLLRHRCVLLVATGARSAEGRRYASTAANAASARSAEGRRYASTAADAASARSAEGRRYASTAADAASSRSAEGRRYASMAACATGASNANHSVSHSPLHPRARRACSFPRPPHTTAAHVQSAFELYSAQGPAAALVCTTEEN